MRLIKGQYVQVLDYLSSKWKMCVSVNEHTKREGETVVVDTSLINRHAGVKTYVQYRFPIKPSTSAEHIRLSSLTARFFFRSRSVGPGYRFYKMLNLNRHIGINYAAINITYEETQAAGEAFRLSNEIVGANTPTIYYFNNEPYSVDQQHNVTARSLLHSCWCAGMVSVDQGAVHRDIEKPDGGDAYFLLFCLASGPPFKEFHIITDGEKFYPTTKVNAQKWKDGEPVSIWVRHKFEDVDLKIATTFDKILVTASIKSFLDD